MGKGRDGVKWEWERGKGRGEKGEKGEEERKMHEKNILLKCNTFCLMGMLWGLLDRVF